MTRRRAKRLQHGQARAFAASSSSPLIIGAHLVPMVRLWVISGTSGAILLSVFFFSAIAGTILFGWLADWLGASIALTLLVFSSTVAWLLYLLHPPFAGTAAICSLLGSAGAGVVPVFSLVLSETFGRESFSRAFGLTNLVSLPFSVLCVPAAALVFTRTGSYAGAIVGVAIFLT
jgi:MFS family permease